ncbi:hypothetical protein KIPB_007945, partial [Kipferlia bialata]|eukprot:g7945.t1
MFANLAETEVTGVEMIGEGRDKIPEEKATEEEVVEGEPVETEAEGEGEGERETPDEEDSASEDMEMEREREGAALLESVLNHCSQCSLVSLRFDTCPFVAAAVPALCSFLVSDRCTLQSLSVTNCHRITDHHISLLADALSPVPLALLETAEGEGVPELEQVQFQPFCTSLRVLNLSGNAVTPEETQIKIGQRVVQSLPVDTLNPCLERYAELMSATGLTEDASRISAYTGGAANGKAKAKARPPSGSATHRPGDVQPETESISMEDRDIKGLASVFPRLSMQMGQDPLDTPVDPLHPPTTPPTIVLRLNRSLNALFIANCGTTVMSECAPEGVDALLAKIEETLSPRNHSSLVHIGLDTPKAETETDTPTAYPMAGWSRGLFTERLSTVSQLLRDNMPLVAGLDTPTPLGTPKAIEADPERERLMN